jgi:hypothetical protein
LVRALPFKQRFEINSLSRHLEVGRCGIAFPN